MRLILEYRAGDGYTWWADCIIPFEYESEEALLILFEEKLDEAIRDNEYEFNVLGETFKTRDFNQYTTDTGNYYKHLPDITNLDQWFEKNKRNGVE